MLIKLCVWTFLLTASTAHAITFCTGNSTSLQNVLNLAGSNGQDDVIKIKTGTYISLDDGFIYQALNEDFDIEISGGWATFLSDCDIQFDSPSQATLLDGMNAFRALVIRPGNTSADIRVSNITFINGFADMTQHGGGLYIDATSDFDGRPHISNNYFLNNYAGFESALFISSGNRIDVKNNLFVANETESGAAIGLLQNDATGIYFSNNTVISNTGWGYRVFVNGTSQALIANNILWDNNDFDLVLAGDGTKYAYHNDIGSQFNAADFQSGNFSEEPVFDGGFLDFTPALSSSLVNRGFHPLIIPIPPIPFQRNWTLGPTDVTGGSRVLGNRVDIGAFEAPAEVPIFIDGFE